MEERHSEALAEGGALIVYADGVTPEVLQLQTLQDFDRWKSDEVLAEYTPAGYSAAPWGYRPTWEYPNANLDEFATFAGARAPARGPHPITTRFVGWRPGLGSHCWPSTEVPDADITGLQNTIRINNTRH